MERRLMNNKRAQANAMLSTMLIIAAILAIPFAQVILAIYLID